MCKRTALVSAKRSTGSSTGRFASRHNARPSSSSSSSQRGSSPSSKLKILVKLVRVAICSKSKTCLGVGMDVNAKYGEEGFFPLIGACKYGHLDIVKLLIEQGADVNAKDIIDGSFPLLFASATGHLHVVKSLLEHGADVNAKNNEGTSSLYFASQQGQSHIVKFLLEQGADVNAKNNDGAPACGKGLFEDVLVQVLGDWDGVEQVDNEDFAVLCLAVHGGSRCDWLFATQIARDDLLLGLVGS